MYNPHMHRQQQQQQQQQASAGSVWVSQFPAKFLQCEAKHSAKWHLNEQSGEVYCGNCYDKLTDMVDTLRGFVATKQHRLPDVQCHRDLALWVDPSQHIGIAVVEYSEFKGFPVEMQDGKQQPGSSDPSKVNLVSMNTAVQFSIVLRNLTNKTFGDNTGGGGTVIVVTSLKMSNNKMHWAPLTLQPGETSTVRGPFTYVHPSSRERQEQIAWEAETLPESLTLQWKPVVNKPAPPLPPQSNGGGASAATAPGSNITGGGGGGGGRKVASGRGGGGGDTANLAGTISSPFSRSDIHNIRHQQQQQQQPQTLPPPPPPSRGVDAAAFAAGPPAAALPPTTTRAVKERARARQPEEDQLLTMFSEHSNNMTPNQTVTLMFQCKQDDNVRYESNMQLWDSRCQQRLSILQSQLQKLMFEQRNLYQALEQKNAEVNNVNGQIQRMTPRPRDQMNYPDLHANNNNGYLQYPMSANEEQQHQQQLLHNQQFEHAANGGGGGGTTTVSGEQASNFPTNMVQEQLQQQQEHYNNHLCVPAGRTDFIPSAPPPAGQLTVSNAANGTGTTSGTGVNDGPLKKLNQ